MAKQQRCKECWHWIPCEEEAGEWRGFCFCWKETGKQDRLAKEGKDCPFYEEIPLDVEESC